MQNASHITIGSAEADEARKNGHTVVKKHLDSLTSFHLLEVSIQNYNHERNTEQFRIPDIISSFVLCVVSKTPKIVTLEKGGKFLNLATLFVPDATLL